MWASVRILPLSPLSAADAPVGFGRHVADSRYSGYLVLCQQASGWATAVTPNGADNPGPGSEVDEEICWITWGSPQFACVKGSSTEWKPVVAYHYQPITNDVIDLLYFSPSCPKDGRSTCNAKIPRRGIHQPI